MRFYLILIIKLNKGLTAGRRRYRMVFIVFRKKIYIYIIRWYSRELKEAKVEGELRHPERRVVSMGRKCGIFCIEYSFYCGTIWNPLTGRAKMHKLFFKCFIKIIINYCYSCQLQCRMEDFHGTGERAFRTNHTSLPVPFGPKYRLFHIFCITNLMTVS